MAKKAAAAAAQESEVQAPDLSGDVMIRYNHTGVMGCDGFTLLPGLNPVPASKWHPHRKHPIIKALMNEGKIEEIGDIDSGKKGSGLSVLVKMSVNEAKNVASETIDMSVLQGWLAIEKRDIVKAAIREQLTKLEAPIEYRGTGSEDESTSADPIIPNDQGDDE